MNDAVVMMPHQRVMMDFLRKNFFKDRSPAGVFPDNFAKGCAKLLFEEAQRVSNSIPKEDYRTFTPSKHLEEKGAAKQLSFDEHGAGPILAHTIIVGCVWFMPVDGKKPPPDSQRAQLINILAELANMSEAGRLLKILRPSDPAGKPFNSKKEFSTVCFAAEVLWGDLFYKETSAYIRHHDLLAQLHFRKSSTYIMEPDIWCGGAIELNKDSAAVAAAERDQIVQSLGAWILRSDKAYMDKIWDCAERKDDASAVLESLINLLDNSPKRGEVVTKALLREAADELREFLVEKSSDFWEISDSPLQFNS